MAKVEHGKQPKASAQHKWNDRIVSSHGYIKIRVGKEHPLADPNGYAYEHTLVWVSAGNPWPVAGHVLRHKNEDKTDSRIENLRCITRAEHNALNNAKNGRTKAGTFRPGVEHNGRPQP